mmetsp:Transcript_48506/g.135571  ORF Transcript_48506/g.135571 Transcript_48506/m.135571 type:complete len:126 (+) Transcript_48506:1438-1815(+)
MADLASDGMVPATAAVVIVTAAAGDGSEGAVVERPVVPTTCNAGAVPSDRSWCCGDLGVTTGTVGCPAAPDATEVGGAAESHGAGDGRSPQFVRAPEPRIGGRRLRPGSAPGAKGAHRRHKNYGP